MLFHTWVFAIFFLLVFPVHYFLRHDVRAMNLFILAASYVFYGWWNPLYLILIAATTTFDWFLGLMIDRQKGKKAWLTLSLLSNLGLLAFYKYAGFVTENLNVLISWTGTAYRLPLPDILLPVGISFFTFQSMSYTIDVYRGKIPVERSLVRFAAFVSLFPQLVAGPIERASSLLPQLHSTPSITAKDLTEGLSHFLVGLFKKVALADYLAQYVDPVFRAPGEHAGPALLLATFAFAWQIYFDFSGYTDMARGVGRMMGFRLMLNFNNPYVATGLGDFWNRWHISLSTWFKDYVYFPLGGNRGGAVRTYVNMTLTMLISGFWHGPAWTFIIWGALHALGRLATRGLEQTAFYRDRVPTFLKQLAVFAFVCLTWIFFRAGSVEYAWIVLSRIFTTGWSDPRCPLLLLGLVGSVWLYQFLYSARPALRRLLEPAPVRVGLATAMAVYLAVVAQAGSQAFIYFQF